MLFAGGQWLRVEGQRPQKDGQPYLYLFNHESLMDAFMLGGAVKHYITAVGAEYQFSYPIWGTLAKRHGAISIKRDKLKKAIHSLDKAEEAIRKGISFIISPEGTRTLSGQLGEFKKGPFHIALNTGVTIVPVALMGAYEAKKKTDWRLSPGILTICFGEPVTAEQYKSMDIDILRAHIREKIQQLIDNKRKGK
ncbi:MAG: 1-acyl-sn-glycerol-3-phosphate acyltransferase [Candidatus Marinimicrobia bacterium]|jgi:1-acyl-sn-glycerol-3-phosphate acyltransferase|nr:1-acyl-sn-glycerol-3-phosphate acyltransferase [Candidatus Neomarinimicrobiota bacterium]|tara:strand:+ start:149 stop:730 length:582 start_codon:yes stop_codon:yes gene_type:complete